MTELIPQPSDSERQKALQAGVRQLGPLFLSVNKDGRCACGRYDRRPAKVMREAAEKLDVPYPLD